MNILSSLIKIPSVTGDEKNLAEYILNHLKNIGVNAIRKDKNIIVYVPGRNKTSCLIFNAHMDTVSPGNISFWKYKPFEAVEKNGRIYGLGASDDKAGIAALISLTDRLKHDTPECDVWITFVTNEETNGQGTKLFLSYFQKHKNKYKTIAAVVAEPTDCDIVEIGHRGSIKIQITTYGDSGHGSRPYEIKNHAIENMISVIKKMKNLEKNAKKKFKDQMLGIPTFALTRIFSSESFANKIPKSCSTIWDIRTTSQLHFNLVSFLKKEFPHTISIEKIELPEHPPAAISKQEPIVNIFKKISPNIRIKVSPGANDMYFFIHNNIPAVSFGPGTKAVIHKENEYVEIKNIQEAAKIYRKIITEYTKYHFNLLE